MKRLATAACLAPVAALLLAAPASGATITPNGTADDYDAVADANCSLREAVQSAVNNAPFGGCPTGDGGTDTIVLTGSLFTPYTLTIGSNAEEANAEGDLDVGAGGPILIRGTGTTTIRTLAPDRVIDVKSGAALTLRNLVVDDGDVTTEVMGSNVGRGGNIRASGPSSLALDGVTVSDGQALDGGGGIYVNDPAQATTIDDSRILDNTDENTGGGIFVQGSGSFRLNRSTVDGNSLETALVGNKSGGGIRAGVTNGSGLLSIADSVISDNFVHHAGGAGADQSYGGGLSITSQATIRRTLITGNNVEAAQNNNQERGGAIEIDGGQSGEVATIVNSTIYGNRAGEMVGSNDGQGGGVYENGEVDLVLRHVTMADNVATDTTTADHIQRGSTGTGEVRVRASILQGSIVDPPCDGSLIGSEGFNVAIFDPDCNFGPSDSIGVGGIGLQAGAPTDNGGFTDTIGLNAVGRAIDLVPAGACGPSESQDQRGFFRPSGSGCDAGAYERVTCNGVVQEGSTALDCPPPPVTGQPTPGPTPQAGPPKKCKKPKKKKGRSAGVAAKKKAKGCKKKKKKKKRKKK